MRAAIGLRWDARGRRTARSGRAFTKLDFGQVCYTCVLKNFFLLSFVLYVSQTAITDVWRGIECETVTFTCI